MSSDAAVPTAITSSAPCTAALVWYQIKAMPILGVFAWRSPSGRVISIISPTGQSGFSTV